jgi:hypothetical protein
VATSNSGELAAGPVQRKLKTYSKDDARMSILWPSTSRVAFLAAAIIALGFGVGAAFQVERRMYMGYRVAENNRVTRVDVDGPGAAAGLRVGDVIRNVNGIAADRWNALPEARRRAPEVSVAWPVEIERNGETVRLQISPTGLPAQELRLARARSLLGVFFVAFPLWALFRSTGGPAPALALFGLSFGFLLMGAPRFASPAVRSVLDGVAILALYAGIAALVHFLLALPPRHRLLLSRSALVVLYGPAAIAVLVSIAGLNLPTGTIPRSVLGTLSTVVPAVYLLSAIVLLIWRYVAASRADRSKRGLNVMLAGMLAAVGPLLLYPVVTSLWPDSTRYYQIIASTYSPPLTLALIPIAFSVAVLRSARSEEVT